MTIKDILAKLVKGETLTAEELAFLKGYDPQKDIDSAAAAARKKSEADAAKAVQDLAAAQQQLKDAQTKLDEAGSKGKTDLQKLQDQLAVLQKQVETATSEKQKLVRQQKLDDVIRKSGLPSSAVSVALGLTNQCVVSAVSTQCSPVFSTRWALPRPSTMVPLMTRTMPGWPACGWAGAPPPGAMVSRRARSS